MKKKIIIFWLITFSLVQASSLLQARVRDKHEEVPKSGNVVTAILGAVGLIGAGIAGGIWAYNYSYNDLKSFINDARREEQHCQNQFKKVLSAYEDEKQRYRAWESKIFTMIKQAHRAEFATSGHKAVLRSSYPLLWYADMLNKSISALQDLHSKLVSYRSAVEKDAHYYRHLSGDRLDAELRLDLLLKDVTIFYDDLVATYEYNHQQDECRKQEEMHAVEEFAAILRKKELDFNVIDRPLGSLHSLSDVIDQLLFGDSSVVFSLNDIIAGQFIRPALFSSTTREHYPKLWFEDKLARHELDIQSLQNDLQQAHARVATFDYYVTKLYLETEYLSLINRMSNTITMLRITREKLRLSYAYRAELRAYDDACAQERYERLERQRLEAEKADRERRIAQCVQERQEELACLERLERERYQEAQEVQLVLERIQLERERELLELRREKEERLQQKLLEQKRKQLEKDLRRLEQEKRNAVAELQRVRSRFDQARLEEKIRELEAAMRSIKDDVYFSRPKNEKEVVVNVSGHAVSG